MKIREIWRKIWRYDRVISYHCPYCYIPIARYKNREDDESDEVFIYRCNDCDKLIGLKYDLVKHEGKIC